MDVQILTVATVVAHRFICTMLRTYDPWPYQFQVHYPNRRNDIGFENSRNARLANVDFAIKSGSFYYTIRNRKYEPSFHHIYRYSPVLFAIVTTEMERNTWRLRRTRTSEPLQHDRFRTDDPMIYETYENDYNMAMETSFVWREVEDVVGPMGRTTDIINNDIPIPYIEKDNDIERLKRDYTDHGYTYSEFILKPDGFIWRPDQEGLGLRHPNM
jgi:hypothetical protein